MKKLALTIAIAAMAACSHAQGWVQVAGTFANFTNSSTLTTSWAGGSNSLNGTQALLPSTSAGGSFDMALLALTGTQNMNLFGDATLTSDWGYTGLTGANNTFAGRLTIGGNLQTATNAPVGVSTTFILLSWSANLGTLSQVESELAAASQSWTLNSGTQGFVGWSVAGTGAPSAAAPATPLAIQGPSGSIIPQGMQLFTVPVPEPTTLALAGLGGLSMLFLRRRKS